MHCFLKMSVNGQKNQIERDHDQTKGSIMVFQNLFPNQKTYTQAKSKLKMLDVFLTYAYKQINTDAIKHEQLNN